MPRFETAGAGDEAGRDSRLRIVLRPLEGAGDGVLMKTIAGYPDGHWH